MTWIHRVIQGHNSNSQSVGDMPGTHREGGRHDWYLLKVLGFSAALLLSLPPIKARTMKKQLSS